MVVFVLLGAGATPKTILGRANPRDVLTFVVALWPALYGLVYLIREVGLTVGNCYASFRLSQMLKRNTLLTSLLAGLAAALHPARLRRCLTGDAIRRRTRLTERAFSHGDALHGGRLHRRLAVLQIPARGGETRSGPRDRESIAFSLEREGEWKMSDAAALHAGAEPQESPLTPESWGKLGMWLFLAGDAMSFGCLIVGYGILRHASKSWPVPAAVLGINLTAFMTFVLIVSSVTMVLSLSGIQHGDRARFKKFRPFAFWAPVLPGLPGSRMDALDS